MRRSRVRSPSAPPILPWPPYSRGLQMMFRSIALLGGAAIVLAACVDTVRAPPPGQPMVRMAELEIDPTHLDAYEEILAEEQEASVRLEPGVLMLHSVSLADSP